MKKKVIILGSQGMLGQALTELFSADTAYAVEAWDKQVLDITDAAAVEARLVAEQPHSVLNAVAYNAVDACEENDAEYARALQLNRDVPGVLAQLSRKLDFLLVHFSTDYVFDGTIATEERAQGCGSATCCGGNCHAGGEQGYGEEAVPHPISRYGESKAQGEVGVKSLGERYYLIRLSKLFGKPGNSPTAKRSFFEVMLKAGRERTEVQAVDSETSKFTYAPDLAWATKALIEEEAPYGIYHLVNEGAVTWYEAACELYRQAGIKTPVIPVGPETFPRPAHRPLFSALINTKRPPLRRYEAALTEYLSQLA